VLDAAGSDRAVVMGFSEGGPACALLAASAPERVISLILYGSFAGPPGDDANLGWQERWLASVDRLEDLVANWGQGKLIDCFAPSAANRFQRREAFVAAQQSRLPRRVFGLFPQVWLIRKNLQHNIGRTTP